MERFFIFLLLISNFLLPICGQVRADVDTLRPTGDRAYTTWTDYPVLGDDYDKIDDITPDGDATYLWTKNTGTSWRQGWSHTDWTTSDNIDSVRLTIRAKSAATTGTPQIILTRFSYVEFWGVCGNRDTVSIDTDYTDYSITWSQDPCDVASWNTTRLNNTNRAWGWQSHAVGTSPDSFGRTSATTPFNVNTGYFSGSRFQSDFAGKIDTLLVYYCDNPTTSIKLGLYSDSGTGNSVYPYERLDTCAIYSPSNGWNRIPLVTGDISISENVYYWIIYRVSAINDSLKRENTSPTITGMYRASFAYSTAWPATAPAGGNKETQQYMLQAVGKETQDNRVTQSFIEVFYSEAEAAAKRLGGIVQDEDSRGIVEGGIAK